MLAMDAVLTKLEVRYVKVLIGPSRPLLWFLLGNKHLRALKHVSSSASNHAIMLKTNSRARQLNFFSTRVAAILLEGGKRESCVSDGHHSGRSMKYCFGSCHQLMYTDNTGNHVHFIAC